VVITASRAIFLMPALFDPTVPRTPTDWPTKAHQRGQCFGRFLPTREKGSCSQVHFPQSVKIAKPGLLNPIKECFCCFTCCFEVPEQSDWTCRDERKPGDPRSIIKD